MEPAFLQAKRIIQKAHNNCGSKNAWNEKSQTKFARCTEELTESIPWLGEAFKDLENFAAGNMNSTMPIEAKIGHLTMGRKYYKSHGLETALQNIKDMSESTTTSILCSEIPGCQEKVRRIILQLLMMEWGILELGDLGAGIFLAKHFSQVGPYFGSTDGPNWPSTPLSKEPSLQESYLKKEMMRLTQILSNGKLKNISILDLPAFGSKLAHFERRHKGISNWPNEVNFAIRDELNVSLPIAFEKYKLLIDHWRYYMRKIVMKDSSARFSPEMKNSYLFDFTKYIKKDMKTFLIALHGSFLTASREAVPTWRQVADESFNQTRMEHIHGKVNLYDKLVMQYAFKQNIYTKQQQDYDGGSELFTPTLTTNGMCYSFNGQNSSGVWKAAEVTNTFAELFPQKNSIEYFQGAQVTDGEFLVKLFFMHSKSCV